MSQVLSIAASLSPDIRQAIGIQVLSRSQPISHLADKHQVRGKFVYQQGDKAQHSLDEAFEGFCTTPQKGIVRDEMIETHPLNSCWAATTQHFFTGRIG